MCRFKPAILFSSLLVAPCLLANPATADTIILQNGDKVSGTIIRKENSALTINTSYAGTITIKWEEVGTIATASRVSLYIEPGDVLEETLAVSETGTVLLRETGTTISIDAIRYINPPPTSHRSRLPMEKQYQQRHEQKRRKYQYGKSTC